MTADPRSPLVLDTRELDRRAGSTRHVHRSVAAPAGLAIPTAQVAPGSPLLLDIDVDSIVDGLWVAGTATVQVSAECVRCLDEVVSPLTSELAALYVSAASERGAGPGRGAGSARQSSRAERHTAGRVGLDAEDDSDDDTVFALDGDLLDLEQMLRDAIVLDLPLRPVCSQDCAGLRLDGTRAGSGQAEAPVDPRWAALADLVPADASTPTRQT